MNLFFWRNNSIIDTFASGLANDLFSFVQPQEAKYYFDGSRDKKQLKNIRKNFEKSIQKIIKKINEFKLMHSIGVYGKARLHMKLKERLEELGYTPDISFKINETLMVKTP